MIEVKEVLKMEKITALVCDLFPDDAVTNRLRVGDVIFNKGEFVLPISTVCFSEPTTRMVVLRITDPPENVYSIEFL